MHLLLKQKVKWFILLVLLAVAGNSQGQSITVLKKVLDGSKSQVAIDSSITVTDSVYFDVTVQNKLDTPYQVKNIITLHINESAAFKLPVVFTASVNVRIIYTRPDFVIDSVDKTLSINYSDTSSYTSRSSFVFSNAHKVTVKILSVTTNATSDVLPVLLVENEMDVHPVYKLSCTTDAVKGIYYITPVDSADQISVNWDALTGADVYDLEWTYIDNSAMSRYITGTDTNKVLIFQNNASRVTLADNAYNIPLLFDSEGTLFFRVRGVQEKANNVRIETAWSTSFAAGLGSYNYAGHHRSLNWQSTVSFAEDGKRKVAVQYYDGSLRSRQTVTKDNTTNTIIVGESLYDYQGRPVISVMPAPSLANVIKYSRNFNVGLNGAEYDKGNYDTLLAPEDFLTTSAKGMSTIKGANNYYSPDNPEKNTGFNQYIPDAGGFAFTETSFTQDNTGRISRQSGVGPVFKLGSNHETRYSYGSPGENDLDVLFGTEAGDKSHYFKNAVQDANGQIAVSYVDMHGRTIATALAGLPDSANLEGLASAVPFEVTDTLSRPSSNIIKDLVMESSQSQLVAVDTTYHFKYLLTPPVLQKTDCNNNTVCYIGRYDLEIKITDDAFNQHLGGQPFDTIVHNYTSGAVITNCNAPDPILVEFTLRLPKGNYEISKRLTVNREAMDYYRDSIFMKKNLCKTLEQFVQEQRTVLLSTQCIPDCKSCRDSVGTWDVFRSNYMRRAGIATLDSINYRQEAKSAYVSAIGACDALCNEVSDIKSVRDAMLIDVNPASSGQYAKDTLDKYSIFYQPNANFIPPYQRDTVRYLDENGRPDSVYNELTNTFVTPQKLTPEQFAAKFKSSWAEALLKFHPEYCKLIAYQQYQPSLNWDRKFGAVDTYAAAKAAGYLNPTANSSLVGFPIVGANKDSLLVVDPTQQTPIETRLKNYNKRSGSEILSLWSAATITLKCTDAATTTACFTSYGTPAAAFNEGTMCAGDLDMAWRNFRQMYLQMKQDIISTKMKTPECVKGSDLTAAGKTLNFTNTTDVLSQNGLSYLQTASDNSNGTVVRDSSNAALARSYAANCQSYVSEWVKKLSLCYSKTVIDNEIIPKLLNVCKEGSDTDHPYGSSTVRPASTYIYSSFQAVLTAYNIANSLDCNPYIITAPQAYDKQRAYSDRESYTKPSDCECRQLDILRKEYSAYKKPADTTFSAFLYRTRGVSLPTSQLDLLQATCNIPANSTCTYLDKPVKVPALIQCNVAPACASCFEIHDLYIRFLNTYPEIGPTKNEQDTVQQKQNQLFAAYMNANLGFSKQAAEYLAFMDSCNTYSPVDSPVCKHEKNLMHSYTNTGNDIISDVIRNSDSTYVMAGLIAGTGNNTGGYLLKTDNKGNVIWAKSYGGNGIASFAKVRATSDGGYIAIGTAKNLGGASGNIFIVKTTGTGDTTWSRRIGYTVNGEQGSDIIQLSDGSYAFIGTYNVSNGSSDWLVGALTSSGNGTWTRRLGNSSGDVITSMLQHNDTLVIVGGTFVTGNYDGVVVKLNRGTGLTVDVYKYDLNIPNTSNFSGFIYKTTAGYALNFANTGDGGINYNSLLTIKENGDVISGKTFTRPLDSVTTQWMPLCLTSDGGYMTVQNFSNEGRSQMSWQRINAAQTLSWANWTMVNGSVNLNKVLQNPDGSFTGGGTYNNKGFLMFTQPSGKEGCSDSTLNIGYTDMYTNMVKGAGNMQNNPLPDSTKRLSIIPVILSPGHQVLDCTESDSCYTLHDGPLLCGNAAPLFPAAIDSINNCSDNEFFAVSKGTELFKTYRDSIKNTFNDDYIATALQAAQKEIFTVRYVTSEYHYTLYYYDLAGNLVKTVPPAGVVIDRSESWVNRVRAARAKGDTLAPPHQMITQYRYNSLNQVIAQQTPDAGASKFWYDRLGRLAISQNAKQALLNQYSYTTYDILGRISEVGEITSATAMTKETSRSAENLIAWLNNANNTRTQITHTNYDIAYSAISQLFISPVNLRNRVSWSAIYNTEAAQTSGNYSTGTFYSYDIHGNVDTLLQDYKIGGINDGKNRFKKMVYRYDLISGKVNEVAYQPGEIDAFYHRYSYDAENRITNVQTSYDGIYWENDAYYQYYKHGPLAKTIIGQQQVQGLDYAYTLQGWLKGINSTAVTPAYDMGKDGTIGSMVAKDVFGLALHYYGNRDYKPINSVVTPFASVTALNPLFNGNIAAISQSLPSLGTPLLYSYNYDVLNRLKKMQASNGLNTTNNTWTPVALPDFKESISYDANGNILTYNRKGNNTFAGKPLAMDSLTYTYQTGTNKLDFIDDKIDVANYDNDIDNQSAANYTYDAIGNLKTDNASNITNITWNVYGKIANIAKSNGPTITYTYDVAGNRVSKSVNGVETWYVRDATGNVMSIYTKGDPNINNGATSQTETDLYGSSRLGINTLNTNVTVDPIVVNLPGLGSGFNTNFIRGKKFFELSNHLGNVLATVSDRKLNIYTGSTFDHYEADIVSFQEYYSFGMQMPGRGFSSSKYRYGFNGQEKSFEINSDGNSMTAEFWEYDSRIGRRWNIDPKSQVALSPYNCFNANPIMMIDVKGDEAKNWIKTKDGKMVYDSRVTSQSTADAFYDKGTYHAPGYSYTATTQEHIVLGENGDFTSNGVAKHSADNATQKIFTSVPEWAPVIVGSADASFSMGEAGYDHDNYLTTRGILMPIFTESGRVRSARAQNFLYLSRTIKGTAVGLSVANNVFAGAQVYNQYAEGGMKNINKVDATSFTLGTTGLVTTGLSWAGYAGPVISGIGRFSGWGGMAIGAFQSWWMIYKTFEDLSKMGNTTGDFETDFQLQQEYNKGFHSELDYYR